MAEIPSRDVLAKIHKRGDVQFVEASRHNREQFPEELESSVRQRMTAC